MKVPDAIGEGEDWDQARQAMREGFQAFLDDEEPRSNPYIRKPGENFSGYKRKKENVWDAGYGLAAVWVGEASNKEDVSEQFGERHATDWPREPHKSIYSGTREQPLGRDAEYLFHVGLLGWGEDAFFEARHDAIGAAVKNRYGLSTKPALRVTKRVTLYERVRRPQLPAPEE